MKYDIRQAAQALISQLKAIDYERLPISKYNKRYIARLKPVLSYYMKIYADCLLKGLESIGSSPEEITLIDYGGGSICNFLPRRVRASRTQGRAVEPAMKSRSVTPQR